MSILHLLNRTALWTRDDPTGNHGRFPDARVTLDAALPFRVQQAGASERFVGDQLRSEVSHKGFSEPDIDLKRDDLLTIDGVTYLVLAKLAPSKPEHHLEWALQAQQYGAVA